MTLSFQKIIFCLVGRKKNVLLKVVNGLTICSWFQWKTIISLVGKECKHYVEWTKMSAIQIHSMWFQLNEDDIVWKSNLNSEIVFFGVVRI
jgi:hypothetical protein